MPQLDLIVRAGLVVDGSGGSPFTADIAVHDSAIVDVGRVRERARRVIDADGALVIPGLIALFPPSEVAEFDRNRQHHLAPGVTTTIELFPDSVQVDQSSRFLTTATGQSMLDRAFLVSHDRLRSHTMGNKVRDGLAPSGGEIETMADLFAGAVAGGSIGLASSVSGGPDELNSLTTATAVALRDRAERSIPYAVVLTTDETDPAELIQLGRYVKEATEDGSVVVTCSEPLDDPDLITALTAASTGEPLPSHLGETKLIVGPGLNPLSFLLGRDQLRADLGLIATMWSDSATAFGLHDRGRIEVGRRGDLNVLDHVHLADDLATGVVSTLLGGVEVVSFDELTGVSAGMPGSVPSSTHK